MHGNGTSILCEAPPQKNNNKIKICKLSCTHTLGPYRYMEGLLKLDASRSRISPFKEFGSPFKEFGSQLLQTPLQWQEWDRSLAAHPNQRFRSYIVNGIRYGFRVGFDNNKTCTSSTKNMHSAEKRPQVIREYLPRECSEGCVLGPLDPMLFSFTQVSGFGVVPKHTPGRWQLIVDMSSPEGHSVNDGIPEPLCSLTYVSIQDSVRGILSMG